MGIETLVTIVVAIFASAGFWNFISGRLQRKDKKQDDKDELETWRQGADKYHEDVKESIQTFQRQLDLQSDMLMGLGHDRIVWLGDRYLTQGYITLEEYEDLDTYLYRPYKALGGNGTAEKIMTEIQKLPCLPETPAKED